MTVRFYIHLIAKRAEAIALLDSGAMENFMNLSYAKWLKLPIKQLDKLRKLFNMDRTKNRSGELCFYMDLQVHMGGHNIDLQFFLSNLGEHKAILRYCHSQATVSFIPTRTSVFSGFLGFLGIWGS